MRPTDEDQHGYTRPNLLSGARHRFGSDDNILERLERDSARQASGNRSRAAWYAAAASLVLLVLVVVAWMAYENARDVHVVPMTREPAGDLTTAPGIAPDAPSTPSAVAASAQSAPATVLEMDVHPAATPVEAIAPVPAAPATILPFARPPASLTTVAATPAPPRDSAPAHPPPLVLLPEKEVVPHKPPLPRKAAASRPVVAVARAKPAASTTSAPQQQAPVARATTRTAVAARPRQPAGKSMSSDAVVDRDVALLSAIIIHDSAHAEEKAQLEAGSACARAAERKCGRR